MLLCRGRHSIMEIYERSGRTCTCSKACDPSSFEPSSSKASSLLRSVSATLEPKGLCSRAHTDQMSSICRGMYWTETSLCQLPGTARQVR